MIDRNGDKEERKKLYPIYLNIYDVDKQEKFNHPFFQSRIMTRRNEGYWNNLFFYSGTTFGCVCIGLLTT